MSFKSRVCADLSRNDPPLSHRDRLRSPPPELRHDLPIPDVRTPLSPPAAGGNRREKPRSTTARALMAVIRVRLKYNPRTRRPAVGTRTDYTERVTPRRCLSLNRTVALLRRSTGPPAARRPEFPTRDAAHAGGTRHRPVPHKTLHVSHHFVHSTEQKCTVPLTSPQAPRVVCAPQ